MLRLPDDEFVKFKKRNTVSNSTTIDLQSISQNNSIFFLGVEYSLDGLEQYSIVVQGNVSTSPLWQKEFDDSTKITVVKDEGMITHIFILTAEGRGDIMYISTDQVTKQPIYGTITDTDYDEDRLKAAKKNADVCDESRMNEDNNDTIEGSAEGAHTRKNETSTDTGNDNEEDRLKSAKKKDNAYDESWMKDGDTDTFVGSIENARTPKATKCTSPKTIEVAIAHDASFCQKFSDNKQRTDSHIQAIIGLASSYYEPVCINLRLTYIDGTCNSGRDEYSSIAKSKSILEDFTSHWRSRKQNVRRDVAHLFSGSSFDQGILGWAWKKTVCSKSNGYGEKCLPFFITP